MDHGPPLTCDATKYQYMTPKRWKSDVMSLNMKNQDNYKNCCFSAFFPILPEIVYLLGKMGDTVKVHMFLMKNSSNENKLLLLVIVVPSWGDVNVMILSISISRIFTWIKRNQDLKHYLIRQNLINKRSSKNKPMKYQKWFSILVSVPFRRSIVFYISVL